MKYTPFRKAFSMMELIFVIVILGVVSSIGAEIIATVYESYIVQKALHRSSIKTQLALNQIINRLRHTIPNSTGRRIGINGTFEFTTTTLSLDNTGNSYNVLQWVGTDIESFQAIDSDTDLRPGWSGFCDITASTTNTISSPGSNFQLTNDIQTSLGRTGNFAVYFPYDPIAHYGTGTGSTISLNNNIPHISEHYKIAWTSYALVVEDGDLMLYYNFPPEIAAPIGNTKTLILKNVTNFKFQNRGDTTRIKICVNENIGGGVSIPSCKEKAVL
jgi:prepilin-type N-terminal cleavage/methylation domain-containing protein